MEDSIEHDNAMLFIVVLFSNFGFLHVFLLDSDSLAVPLIVGNVEGGGEDGRLF